MTTITFGRLPDGAFVGPKFSVVRALRSVVDHYRSELNVRAAVRALNLLDDRVLNDMGIMRSQIEDAVRFGR